MTGYEKKWYSKENHINDKNFGGTWSNKLLSLNESPLQEGSITMLFVFLVNKEESITVGRVCGNGRVAFWHFYWVSRMYIFSIDCKPGERVQEALLNPLHWNTLRSSIVNSFIHSPTQKIFILYYYVSDTILEVGDETVNKQTMSLPPWCLLSSGVHRK